MVLEITTSLELTIGILSTGTAVREQLRRQLQASLSLLSLVEEDEYCSSRGDRAARRFEEARPHIIIVDMEKPQEALQTLKILHESMPGTWLFASAEADNPQLIIETMRAGVREFLPKPVTAEVLSQALDRYQAAQKKQVEQTPRGKIYCVMAAKGGAGTTSVAVNLAVSLATGRNEKVALLDLGFPVGDAAEYLNIRSKFSIADVLASAPRLDPVLLESYMSRTNGIAVLPGFKELQTGMLPPDGLEKMLHVAEQTYTHVFLDAFCSYDETQLGLLTEFSAAIILVLTPELPALWRTSALIRLMEKTGAKDKIKLVVNRASKHHAIESREIEKTLEFPIYWRLPNNYPAAIQAVNSGKPLVNMNRSSLAASYYDLAHALTGVPVHKKSRGLLELFS